MATATTSLGGFAAEPVYSPPRPKEQAARQHGAGNNKVLRDFASSGIAVCAANVATNPIEVIKTRMMLRQKLPAPTVGGSTLQAASSMGFLATGREIVRTEGAKALGRGVQASAARGITFGGIRLGLYGPIKDYLSGDGTGKNLTMGHKLLAGSISGGVGAVVTNPMELIKTRCQAACSAGKPMSEIIRNVLEQQGVLGFWRGATPGVVRSTLLNASMCATYDEVKTQIRRYTGWSDGLATTFTGSMISGLVTTTVINPVDVVRAYIQTGKGHGVMSVASAIWQHEGPTAFMKGWSAAYMRTGPQCVMIFMASEALRPLFGLKHIA